MRMSGILPASLVIAGVVAAYVGGCGADEEASSRDPVPEGGLQGNTTADNAGPNGQSDSSSSGAADASAGDASSDAPKPCTTPAECDDGDPCTTDACGTDGGCSHVLLDDDGDGFASTALGPCGKDCHPYDKLVNPDQKQYFRAPHDGGSLDSGRPDGGSFDYNCDGVEEQRDPELFTKCTVANGVCYGSGWYSFVPGCGETGTYARCGINLGGCNPKSTTGVVHACR